VTSKSIEYGEDYWIDERDLEKAQLREQAIKNRKVSDLIGALLRHPKYGPNDPSDHNLTGFAVYSSLLLQ
jgi:hypothetical protein